VFASFRWHFVRQGRDAKRVAVGAPKPKAETINLKRQMAAARLLRPEAFGLSSSAFGAQAYLP
jgi:hypothetical protein